MSVTPKTSGGVFSTKSLRKAYENVVVAAKLDDLHFHTLRHTFASRAVQRGATLQEVKELLGHGSLAMVMRYTHLSPEHCATPPLVSMAPTPSACPPPFLPEIQRKSQRKRLPA